MWDTGFDLKLGDKFGGFVEEGQVPKCGRYTSLVPEAIAKGNRTPGTYFRNRRFPGLILGLFQDEPQSVRPDKSRWR